MTHREQNALIPRPGTAVTAPGRRTPRVIAEMVRDVLARATDGHLSQARFRIGDYALREPDYRQILRWAEALGEAPEEVLATLAAYRLELDLFEDGEAVAFAVEDGTIVSLAWDLERLPSIPGTWEPGLGIRTLGLGGRWPDESAVLRPRLPRLERLVCPEIGLALLDLSGVPGLTALNCWYNPLTALDLSPVPGLTKLECCYNQLTALDLSPVPGLTELWCGSNQLTELDLSPVPGLTTLDCSENQLTELDLSRVPGLTSLDCDSNQLTELDRSPVPIESLAYPEFLGKRPIFPDWEEMWEEATRAIHGDKEAKQRLMVLAEKSPQNRKYIIYLLE